MPYLNIRGAKLHYLEAGQGKPIICFHSTPASAEFYRPQLEHFSKDYRVIAVDLRGHGESEKPRGQYRISEFVADYVELFEKLELRAHVAPHSACRVARDQRRRAHAEFRESS